MDCLIEVVTKAGLTVCDKVCQWLAAGLWFSPGTLVSSTNKIQWFLMRCCLHQKLKNIALAAKFFFKPCIIPQTWECSYFAVDYVILKIPWDMLCGLQLPPKKGCNLSATFYWSAFTKSGMRALM